MKTISVLLLCFLLGPYVATGDEFSITMENDLFYGSDRHYTHGTRFSYIIDDVADWFDYSVPEEGVKVGITLGQHMYTPSDIKVSEPIVGDRPYGGWAYLGFSLYIRDDNQMDFMEVEMGVTGPSSLSENVQKTIHKWTDSTEPMGWDNQIDNGIGLLLTYQKKFRWRYDGDVDADIISYGGAALGNIFTYADVGIVARAGVNIPNDFGFIRMEPSSRGTKYGVYVFVGAEERYMLRNIFLNGNAGGVDYNINGKEWVSDFSGGVGLSAGKFEIIYGYTYRGKEFREQKEKNGFNTLMIGWGI